MNFSGMPEGGPLVIPGPYRFEGSVFYSFFARTSASQNLHLFLPQGVKLWNPLFPTGMILVIVAQYERVWADVLPKEIQSYNEAMILIPCFHLKSGPAFFCPFMYVDEMMPIAAGREIYGFPKKPAIIDIEDTLSGGKISVIFKEHKLFDINWRNEEDRALPEVVENLLNVTPGVNLVKDTFKKGAKFIEKHLPQSLPFLKIPIINWRRIPEVSSTLKKQLWSVNEITSVRFRIDRINRLQMLDIESNAVQLGGTQFDPLEKFTPLKTYSAIKSKIDFTLPPGKVLQRYSRK